MKTIKIYNLSKVESVTRILRTIEKLKSFIYYDGKTERYFLNDYSEQKFQEVKTELIKIDEIFDTLRKIDKELKK